MLMRILSVLTCVFAFTPIFAQEVLQPIQSLPNGKVLKRSADSFDSTFIYTPDTLSLPFFDDFSKNHFQQYTDDFTGSNVTSILYYKLLDVSDNPLPVTTRYTSQQTIRKTVNTTDLTETNDVLPTTTIKVGDFSSYPPVYSSTTVYPPYLIFDTVDFPNPVDTIWLDEVEFVQDSARQFFDQINDKNSYWLNESAKHSYTNAVDPWTLGVVTFDGTDENGYPYFFGSTSIDFNDNLCSKYINMAGTLASDSVYFSFLYQPQGFNDEPESVDSLVLEFFAPDFNQWFQMWSAQGTDLQNFKKVHLKITDPKFFKATFQFRFRNYSGTSGAIDQFQLDYVRLQKASGFQDTLFKDFSVLYPLTSLLKDYTQVPWDHFKNNPSGKTTDSLLVAVRNSSNVDENYQNGSIIIKNNGITDGTITLLGQDLANNDINYQSNTVYHSIHDISALYNFNSGLSGDHQQFDVSIQATAQFSNFSGNDTATFIQRFYDMYAYDDGSAEAAYGPSGTQARLAYKFTPYEDDTLRGVRIQFVPSVNDVSDKLFLLTVWGDNNGKPGAILYQDDFLNPRQPSYSYDDSLGFTSYYFTDFAKIPVSGTFYVGWRQIDQEPLNIGFDKNTSQPDKIFYSVDNETTWSNTQFSGSLLMRPVFSVELNKTLATETIDPEEYQFSCYPNPSSGTITISDNSPRYIGVTLFDLNGRIILDTHEKELSLTDLQTGVYLLKNKASGKIIKVLKQ